MVNQLFTNGTFITYGSWDYHFEIMSFPVNAFFYAGNAMVASLLETGMNDVIQRYSCKYATYQNIQVLSLN